MPPAVDTGPNVLLVKAVRHVLRYDLALDLGAGKCRDSRFLLNLGFSKIIAIDKTRPDFIPSNDGFQFIKQNLNTLSLRAYKADLISVQFVLPFVKNIPNLINEIYSALNKNGIFVGQFFSPEEMEGKNLSVAFHSLDQVRTILKDFKYVLITEESRFPSDPNAHNKTWHTIDFIVSKS